MTSKRATGSHEWGGTMNALTTTGHALAGAIPAIKPDLDGALHKHLQDKADAARAKHKDYCHICEHHPWTACQRIFEDGIDAYDARDAAFEAWIEAQEELGEAMARQSAA